MDIKEVQRSVKPYDVFGYLIPGAVAMMGIYLHGAILDVRNTFTDNKPAQFDEFVNRLFLSGPSNWYEYTGLSFVFLIVAYILGHIIGSSSSALIDVMLVKRMHGYPYQRLLTMQESSSEKTFAKRKGMLARGSFGLFFVGMALLAVRTAPCIYMTIALGLSLVILAVRMLYADCDDTPASGWATTLFCIGSILSLGLAWVYTVVSTLIASAFRMNEPLPEGTQQLFRKSFEKVFGVPPDSNKLGTDCYWLTCLYLSENSPENYKSIVQWLRLYAFARNLTMTFFFLFLYGAVIGRFDPFRSTQQYPYYCWWPISMGFLSLAFLIRYYYLYYKYYSKCIFRAFIALTANSPTSVPIAASSTGTIGST